MSTRSFIAKKTANGYVAIFCHWDGHPESAGHTLKQYYTNPLKINSLLALGAINSLNKYIGKKHSFDYDKKHPDWTTAYFRDGGVSWDEAKPQIFASFRELVNHAGNDWAEYLYIYANGRWHGFSLVSQMLGNWNAKEVEIP